MGEEKSARFVCRRCGSCCRAEGYVYLAKSDVDRLAAALGVPVEEFLRRYAELGPNRAQLRLAGDPLAPCLFLEGNLCRVYSARPEQCRQFPTGWRSKVGCAAQSAG